MNAQCRSYDPSQDEAVVLELWQKTLGSLWPISPDVFRWVTVGSGDYRAGDHLVAQIGGHVVGFVGTQTRDIPGSKSPLAELMLVMVDPEHQRKGVGRYLLNQAMARFDELGATDVHLGAGGSSYFWPGVPTNLPGAADYFRACGWQDSERSFDLVRDLSDYTTPAGIHIRVQAAETTIRQASPSDIPDILEYEQRYFPRWLSHYRRPATEGEHGDIVLARNKLGIVVGTTLVLLPHARWRGVGFVWDRLLGENAGGLAIVGVAPEVSGQGIGLALAARATEILKEKGVKTAFIGWTWLVDWYGQLGYRVWRDYYTGWKRPQDTNNARGTGHRGH